MSKRAYVILMWITAAYILNFVDSLQLSIPLNKNHSHRLQSRLYLNLEARRKLTHYSSHRKHSFFSQTSNFVYRRIFFPPHASNELSQLKNARDANEISPCHSKESIVTLEESFPHAVLDSGDILVQAVRATIQNSRSIGSQSSNGHMILGYLIQLNSLDTKKNENESIDCIVKVSFSIENDSIDLHDNEIDSKIYDAGCQTIHSLLHYHLLLEQDRADNDGKEWTIQFHIENKRNNNNVRDLLLQAVTAHGFHPINDSCRNRKKSNNGQEINDEDESIILIWNNPHQTMRYLTEYTFSNRGKDTAKKTLEILEMHCKRRLTFEFISDDHALPAFQNDDDFLVHRTKISRCNRRGVIAYQKNLIPSITRYEIRTLMDVIKRNGWLSTNLDSVDMLPSFHLNLVTNGKPLFHSNDTNDSGNEILNYENDNEDDIDHITGLNFKTSVEQMRKHLEPYLYNELLPKAQKLTNSTTLEISDIFIRSYGEEIHSSTKTINDETKHENGNGRLGISAHYDIYSTLTSVIALDDVAAKGTSGLYTIAQSPQVFVSNNEKQSVNDHQSNASNHASLRRFFSLGAGDAVLHSWDILHGVDIEPNQSRTSLIVWFTDYNQNNDYPSMSINEMGSEGKTKMTTSSNPPPPPPWLNNITEDDDIGNFVLASALASLGHAITGLHDDEGDKRDLFPDDELKSRNSKLLEAMILDDSNEKKEARNQSSRYDLFQLYFNSALSGNAFGLCRLGSLCAEEGKKKSIILKEIPSLLANLNGKSIQQSLRKQNDFISDCFYETNNINTKNYHGNDFNDNKRRDTKFEINNTSNLAKGLWFEAAMRGNALAQMSLADECMDEFMTSQVVHNNDDNDKIVKVTTNDAIKISKDEDLILMAYTLFSLAAQQGNEEACVALSKVIGIYHVHYPNSKCLPLNQRFSSF